MNRSDMIIRCLKCGQKNRIPEDHLTDKLLCGKCGASLDEFYIQCLRCHTLNRIPEDRLLDLPVCGKCGFQLYDDYVLDVSEENFDRDVLEHFDAVLVCCFTPDCSFCRKAMPVLKKLAPKYLGNMRLVRLNIEENKMLASKFSIEKTPTYLLFKKGVLIETIVGAADMGEIEKNLRNIVSRLQDTA